MIAVRFESSTITENAFSVIVEDSNRTAITVDLTVEGQEVQRSPGVRGVYQGQAWSIVERSAQVELVNCRQDEGPETRPETHYQEVPTLLLRREGHPDLLVTSTPDDGVYQSYGACPIALVHTVVRSRGYE